MKLLLFDAFQRNSRLWHHSLICYHWWSGKLRWPDQTVCLDCRIKTPFHGQLASMTHLFSSCWRDLVPVQDFYEQTAQRSWPEITTNWSSKKLRWQQRRKNAGTQPNICQTTRWIGGADFGQNNFGKIARMFCWNDDLGKTLQNRRRKKLKGNQTQARLKKSLTKSSLKNPDNVAAYKGGKDKLFGFFVGQVLKNQAAKANRIWSTTCWKQKLL